MATSDTSHQTAENITDIVRFSSLCNWDWINKGDLDWDWQQGIITTSHISGQTTACHPIHIKINTA